MRSMVPPRYVAFLRAINVGGHVIAMARLRSLFEQMGLANVETFIASGNVIFSSRAKPAALERRLEAELQKALGYEVATFLRTAAEVAAIARNEPFPATRAATAHALNVGLLAAPLPTAAAKAVLALRNDVNDFHVQGREVYWLCQGRQTESPFAKVKFEKLTGAQVTFRGIKTMQRLANKYGFDETTPSA